MGRVVAGAALSFLITAAISFFVGFAIRPAWHKPWAIEIPFGTGVGVFLLYFYYHLMTSEQGSQIALQIVFIIALLPGLLGALIGSILAFPNWRHILFLIGSLPFWIGLPIIWKEFFYFQIFA